MNTIEHNTKKILSEQIGINPEKINNHMFFKKDLGLDSIDIIELVMSIEEFFKIVIQDEEIENLRTIDMLIIYIENEKHMKKIDMK